MKKTIAIFLCAILALGLAGCGMAPSLAPPPAQSTAAGDYYEEGPAEAAPPATAGEPMPGDAGDDWRYREKAPGEEYDNSPESPFKKVATSPLSTFSSDVDTASYSSMRRFIRQGQQPEGVRIEELVNYFTYDYPAPRPGDEHPFSITTELAPCPWNEDNLLTMVGIQGAQLDRDSRTASNIVFLLDVSGSMDEDNKLPLLKESFKLLIDQLDEDDTISIVTYAGSDRIVAEGVPGSQRQQLKRLMDDMYAGGSTAGAQGLRTAYQLAEENFIEGGNNRVILATDGDFNVGESSDAAMEALIEKEREKGVFISVLGFGMWNLKDSKMETIADKGNGNYAYIDTLEEARKVLVDEFESTMFTIAMDLKLQVEFNPAMVSQYRLIGYNNRRLNDEDFNDDRKDAGDIGAGHSVTAFYELVPAGGQGPADVDGLKYQSTAIRPSDEYMTVKVRYKDPDGAKSRLVEQPVPHSAYSARLSNDFGFAASVAEFGLILTDSDFRAGSSTKALLEQAKAYRGRDPYGLRAEFIELVEAYRDIAR